MIFNKHKALKILAYKDFNYKQDSYLDISEFSWQDQAYDLLNKYHPVMTDALNNQMNFAFEMTKKTFGMKHQGIDTSKFRQAII